jgi:hypothetical protein
MIKTEATTVYYVKHLYPITGSLPIPLPIYESKKNSIIIHATITTHTQSHMQFGTLPNHSREPRDHSHLVLFFTSLQICTSKATGKMNILETKHPESLH